MLFQHTNSGPCHPIDPSLFFLTIPQERSLNFDKILNNYFHCFVKEEHEKRNVIQNIIKQSYSPSKREIFPFPLGRYIPNLSKNQKPSGAPSRIESDLNTKKMKRERTNKTHKIIRANFQKLRPHIETKNPAFVKVYG